MLEFFFDFGSAWQYLILSTIVAAAVFIVLVSLPLFAIATFKAFLISAAVGAIVFVSLLVGFGGSGLGGGDGPGKGKGDISHQTESQPHKNSQADATERKEPLAESSQQQAIDLKPNQMLVFLEDNHFLIDDQTKSFSEVDRIIQERLTQGSLEKVIFCRKPGYKVKVSENAKNLAIKYGDRIHFDRRDDICPSN